jgi:adenylate cyclase
MLKTRTQRRLAAILAADVVGFSRLMGEDEAAALDALRDMWAYRFDPAVEQHGGRIVKLMGDGALVEFGSAVDAVECAMAIQTAMAEDNAAQPSRRPLLLRIGVNVGDIVIEGDDIFGDGVNVASRLEAQAPHGGVLISDSVHVQVLGKIVTPFIDGGEIALKNIAGLVRVWSWGGSAAASSAPANLPDKPSIAVLPFTNMSGDPDQEYFSDGISEDIITDLSKVSGLMVVARNSSFAYKGKSPDIRDVGRELGVAAVLEGSIRRAGNRARITAQLIDAATGGHLWAERYDRDLTDIFAVQDEVTMRIVDVLKVKLLPSEMDSIASVPTADVAAHDVWLRAKDLYFALFRMSSGQAAMLRKAINTYEEAVALDPGFTQAYASLSLAWGLEFQNRWLGEPQAQKWSRDYALKAIEIGPTEALGHFALAITSLFSGDAAGAKAQAQHALSLNPNFANAYSAIGNAEIFLGKPLEALPWFDIANRLDPATASQTLHFRGLAHLVAGDDEQAANALAERVRLVPGTDISRAFLAAAYGNLGREAEARQVWADLMALHPTYDLAAHLGRLPWPDGAGPARIRAGLAKAGLPSA